MASDVFLVVAQPEDGDYFGDALRFGYHLDSADYPRLLVGEVVNRAFEGGGGSLALWLHPTVVVIYETLHDQQPRELTASLALALYSAFRLTSEHGVYNGGAGEHAAKDFLGRHAGWWIGVVLEWRGV